jgi:hypothetical protein
MIHAALPGMRKPRKGFIVNFSSIGGFRFIPGERLLPRDEVCGRRFVRTTLAGVRTARHQGDGGRVEWFPHRLGRALGTRCVTNDDIRESRISVRSDHRLVSANETKRRIDDYAATAGARISQLRGYSGKQPGDPLRAAHAIVDAVESPNPPRDLLLANAACDLAMAKLDVRRYVQPVSSGIVRRSRFSSSRRSYRRAVPEWRYASWRWSARRHANASR